LVPVRGPPEDLWRLVRAAASDQAVGAHLSERNVLAYRGRAETSATMGKVSARRSLTPPAEIAAGSVRPRL